MAQEGAEETEVFHLSVLCALRALLFKIPVLSAVAKAAGRGAGRFLITDVTSLLLRESYGGRLVRFSRSLSRRFTMRFSLHTLGNLIHRTRLKLAASMLGWEHDRGALGFVGEIHGVGV